MDKPIENINLNFICAESWEAMLSVDGGKHCAKCKRKVVDFTNSSQADYEKVQIESSGNLCGKFKLSQTVYSKIAATVLLSAGISLAANAQTDTTHYKFTPKQHVPNRAPKEYGVLGGPMPVMPAYIGGEEALLKFLKVNIVYPPDLDKDGTVYVQYKIDTLGNVVQPKILRGLSPSADNEVLRVVKMLKYKPYKPTWGDGGTWNLPVKFIAPEKKDEK